MKRKLLIIQMVCIALLLGVSKPNQVMAEDVSEELKNVKLMGAYIDFLVHWIDVIESPSNAIGIAQNSLKDLYIENNEPERLEQTLTRALEIVHDRGARNSIRFTLSEVYQKSGQLKKASEQLIKVIEENSEGSMSKSKGGSVFE